MSSLKNQWKNPLVDIAHILASFLEQHIYIEEDNNTNKISTDLLEVFLDNAGKRRFSSRIYELKKTQVSLGVYVTNKQGIVIYDSNNGQWVGRDFSRKNDVYLTMRGKYGARTTRLDPDDPVSSVAYVAAPIVF